MTMPQALTMSYPTPLDVGKTPLIALDEIERLADAMRNSVSSFATILRGVGADRLTTALSGGDSKPASLPESGDSRVATSAFAWVDGEAERVSLFPIKHDDIWGFRKKLEALHWNAQEVDLTHDKKDWDRMSEPQRHFVRMQLGFFATIDFDVLDNLAENFIKEVDCMEARMTIAAQQDQECVHAESYGLQIKAVMDGAEREAVLNAARTMPIIARMRAWVMRWFDRGLSIGERLVAFAAVEGVLFSASFSALQWLRELNLLPGVTNFNSFIVRDEGIHTLFTCLLVRKYLRVKPPQEHAEAIFSSVVEVLDDFVTESLPVRLIGMNDELMKEYVRFQADCVLIEMGYLPLYRVKNPFPFMDKLTLNGVNKTNFFERRLNDYQEPVKSEQVALGIDDTPIEDF
jgi:ribonucleoside-diphosphate reductase beta chain